MASSSYACLTLIYINFSLAKKRSLIISQREEEPEKESSCMACCGYMQQHSVFIAPNNIYEPHPSFCANHFIAIHS